MKMTLTYKFNDTALQLCIAVLSLEAFVFLQLLVRCQEVRLKRSNFFSVSLVQFNRSQCLVALSAAG